MHLIFVAVSIFLLSSTVYALHKPDHTEDPRSRARTFGSQALNPDLSVIADFLVRPSYKGKEKTFSFREAELGFQAAVDPYSRADIFVAVEEDEGKVQVEIEEGFLTFLELPFKSQAKIGRFQTDFGRTHRTHAPERDFVDAPLSFSKLLGVEKAMKANGASANVLLPIPLPSYHELRTELGETNVQFGEEDEAIKRTERFVYFRSKNFFPITTDLNLELSGGYGRWQTDGGIEKKGSTAKFDGRENDLIRSIGTGDFTLKWKPNPRKSVMLEGNYLYTEARHLKEESGKIVQEENYVADRGGFLQLQVQPFRRWYFGTRLDSVVEGENNKQSRNYSAIITFFPSEFSRLRFQWNRKDNDGEEREHRFFLQITWSIGPHRPHPF